MMDALEKRIVNAYKRASGVFLMPRHKERFMRKLSGRYKRAFLFNTSDIDNIGRRNHDGGFDLPQWATSAAAALLLFVFILPIFVPARLEAEEYLELEMQHRLDNITNRDSKNKRVLTQEVIRQAAFELEQLGYKTEIEGEYHDCL